MANCKTKITMVNDSFTTCGDYGISINNMLSTDVSSLTSIKDFKTSLTSELIDVKSWKTNSSYPTLKLIYDRYLNASKYCGIDSSQFKYSDMMQFSELVGTYWVDLIEQVVPSTTIWGSTYVYGNTIFDQQKFRYKKYSLFTCDLLDISGNTTSPTNGWTSGVTVEYQTLPNNIYDSVSGSTTGETFNNINLNSNSGNTITCGTLISENTSNLGEINTCNGVGVIQTNCGSEFIGKIMNLSEPSSSGDTIVDECLIHISFSPIVRDESGVTLKTTAYVTTPGGPYAYVWDNGHIGDTLTGMTYNGGPYTVTVSDLSIKGCTSTNSVNPIRS